jgi:hypothetical protein
MYSRYVKNQPVWTSLRRGALIDQQLWFLGRDIGAPGGNALLRFGFGRQRPERGGSTAYLLPLPPEREDDTESVLICWGFAMYAGRGSTIIETTESPASWAGVCIERFGSTPRLIAAPLGPTIHQFADLPRGSAPRSDNDWRFTTRLMARMARTCSAYESWAIDTLGDSHRRLALRDAPRHKRLRFTPVPSLASVWDTLRDQWNSERPLPSNGAPVLPRPKQVADLREEGVVRALQLHRTTRPISQHPRAVPEKHHGTRRWQIAEQYVHA